MDVCDIPSNVDFQRELRNVSRAVCRLACSEVYDKECSGFLYSRGGRNCTLSPYTGEWIPTSATANCTTLGLEFYRRSRLLGNISLRFKVRFNVNSRLWAGSTTYKHHKLQKNIPRDLRYTRIDNGFGLRPWLLKIYFIIIYEYSSSVKAETVSKIDWWWRCLWHCYGYTSWHRIYVRHTDRQNRVKRVNIWLFR